jgi:hypothetical protein
MQGDVEGAEGYAKEQLALARQLGHPLRIAISRIQLALVYAWVGAYTRAATLLTEARGLCEENAEIWGVNWARWWQAIVAYWQGVQAGPAAELDVVVAWARGPGVGAELAEALYWRGRIALAAGEMVVARQWLEESLAQAGRLGRRLVAAWGLAGLADLLAALGTEGMRVAQLAGAAAALLATTGGRLWPVEEAAHVAMLARVRPTVDPGSWEAAWAEGGAMTLEQALNLGIGASG